MKKFNKKKIGIIAGVIIVALFVAAFFPFVLPWSYSKTATSPENAKPDFNLSSMFLEYNFGDGENAYTDMSVIGTRSFKLKNYKVANMYFGLPVTSIAPNAFADNTTLESITLPENLKYISDNAFGGCTSLETVSLPKTLITISDTAFENCTALKYNEYENALYLGNDENPYLALISVIDTKVSSSTIHSDARVIADKAFAECNNLQSITFEGAVVPVYAYGDIAALRSVTIKGNATEIPSGAFKDCMFLREVVLPDTVKTIANSAFAGCNQLNNINIPTSLESIGNSAFSKCKSIESFNLPNTLISIGNSAFNQCTVLQEIEIPDSVKSMGDGIFNGCTILQRVKLPSNITSISKDTFSGCMMLKDVEIPATVTVIGNSAFSTCISLESIDLPSSVKTINTSAFSQCSSLVSIDIPDSVTTIGDYAFDGCSALENVRLSKNVTKLGSAPFYGCESLANIEIDENNPNYKSIDGHIYSKDGKTFIQYANGKGSEPFYIPSTVTTIGDSAFRDCKSLTNVIIPASVETIRGFVFFGCSTDLGIYCEVIKQPSGWEKSWNYSKIDVYWGFEK